MDQLQEFMQVVVEDLEQVEVEQEDLEEVELE
jgi:hypothetical protein